MTRPTLDLAAYLARHSVAVTKTKDRADGGQLFELETCPWDPAHMRSAFAGQQPSGALYAGCQHDSCSAKAWADFRDAVEGTGWRETKQEREGGPPPRQVKGPERGELIVTRADRVLARAVEWLWTHRVARRAVNLFDGDPGTGKSATTTDLVARVTTGAPMPFELTGHDPADAIILSYEDDPATTIRPRLEAAGADLTRVHIIEGVRVEDDVIPPSLPEDIEKIGDLIARFNAALAVVDPLMAAISGELDAHRDQDVRRALSRLRNLAQQTGAAFLVIRHLKKSAGPAIYAGGGSIGIIGAARAAHVVGRDPNDSSACVIAPNKVNIAKPVPAVRYRIEDATVYGADGTSIETCRVAWMGEAPELTADMLTAKPAEPEDHSELEEAAAWLRDRLAGGARFPSKAVRAEAREVGIATRTFHRARKALGIKAKQFKEADKLAWFIWLPVGADGQDPKGWPSGPSFPDAPEKAEAARYDTSDGQMANGADGQAGWPSAEGATPARPKPSRRARRGRARRKKRSEAAP